MAGLGGPPPSGGSAGCVLAPPGTCSPSHQHHTDSQDRYADHEPDRYDPEHGIVPHSAAEPLLDHLIRPLQERRRDRQAKRLGGLQVDDQLKLGHLLDGEIGGLGAAEDLVHDDCGGNLPPASTPPTC